MDILKELKMLQEEEKENKPLNKPFRLPSGSKKKFGVYVKNDKGNVVKVTFGDPNLEIKRDDPERLKSFRARHGCDNPGPKWKAKYWSCRFWEKGISVTQLLNKEMMGMAGRVPSCGMVEDTEEGQSETGVGNLPWNISESEEFLHEYEENDFIEGCLKIGELERTLLCLKMARAMCGSNKVCQQRIDRHRDELLRDNNIQEKQWDGESGIHGKKDLDMIRNVVGTLGRKNTEKDLNDKKHASQPTLLGLIATRGGDYQGRDKMANTKRDFRTGIDAIKKYFPKNWKRILKNKKITVEPD